MNSTATHTQETTDATAWRCLALSGRTSCSVSRYWASMWRTILPADQLMNRAASRAPISSSAMGTPRSSIQMPALLAHRSPHRGPSDWGMTLLLIMVCLSVFDARMWSRPAGCRRSCWASCSPRQRQDSSQVGVATAPRAVAPCNGIGAGCDDMALGQKLFGLGDSGSIASRWALR